MSRSCNQDQVSLWNWPELSMAPSICSASLGEIPPSCWNTSFRASHTLAGISLALLQRKKKITRQRRQRLGFTFFLLSVKLFCRSVTVCRDDDSFNRCANQWHAVVSVIFPLSSMLADGTCFPRECLSFLLVRYPVLINYLML